MIELYDIVELIDDYKPEDYNGKLYVEMAGTVIETYDKKMCKVEFSLLSDDPDEAIVATIPIDLLKIILK